MTDTTPAPYGLARLGNGAAVHLTDASGILCNRWGTVNGVWKAPRPVVGEPADATCKRCRKLGNVPAPLAGECDGCQGVHPACFDHVGTFGEGDIFAVPCPVDGLTTFVTREGLVTR